jgi:5-methylcytosine-specific restriction protein B
MDSKMKEIYGDGQNYKNSSLATWEFVNKLKVGDIVYAKRGSSTFLGRGIVTGDYVYDDDREEYYNVRSVKWDIVGEWKVDFKIVLKTLTDITDIENYPEELEKLIKNKDLRQEENGVMNYWWLNGNPKVWSINNWVVGEEQDYTLYNFNGNKRRIHKNFVDAKVGDIVICYEANPTKQIVGIAEVSRAADGEKIYFRKTETLISPIDFKIIKDIPELQGMEFLVNPNGSFFKLTSEEYETIIGLIREVNDRSDKTVQAEEYTKLDFLNEVFMMEGDYISLSSLLLRKKNIILQGAPGVGKTFAAKRLAYSIIGNKNENCICHVQFHQNYSYEDFIMGYKPEEDKFILRKGIFYDFCTLAKNNSKENYFFIIDEINRGNLSKIFGELLMLIENNYRGDRHKIRLAYNNEEFYVPENLYIIGMMNTADRSLAMIDYALRRRFSFFEMKPGFETEGFNSLINKAESDKFKNLIEQIKKLNNQIVADDSLGKGFEIGHSYFCFDKKEDVTDEWLLSIVDYDIIPMLEEYWFDNRENVNVWSKNLREIFEK